jgi:Polyketide cyclase / dehydrase and lipid transport
MATIRKEIPLHASTEHVWDVIRDVGAIHTRLAPGYVVDTRLEEGARVVTFANGVVVRELIVTVDDESRRLAYAVVGGTAAHHNASFQVFPGERGGSVLVWITDIVPDAVAGPFTAMIEGGASVIKLTLDSMSATPANQTGRNSPPARGT